MIKLLVPHMPSIEQAIPYIRRSEEQHHYTNYGPNVRELEERLSVHFKAPHVITVANCTAGLELVYMLKMIQGFRKIELPSLTFAATWLAANRCGLEIVPIDVDQDTWVAPGVAGFGLPTIGPVIDAAPAWGEQRVPVGTTAVFSMHATKSLGAGEGGYIVTHNRWEADDIRRMANFGIEGGVSSGPGTNAKMSEYSAAVALASLDAWDREPWLQLFDWYEKHLPACATSQKRPRGVYPMLPIATALPADELAKHLLEAGVETRRYYCPPMHEHPMFQKMGNREHRRKHPVHLPVTDHLAKRLICLPYHLFLTEADVVEICEKLEKIVQETDITVH